MQTGRCKKVWDEESGNGLEWVVNSGATVVD